MYDLTELANRTTIKLGMSPGEIISYGDAFLDNQFRDSGLIRLVDETEYAPPPVSDFSCQAPFGIENF